MCNFYYEWIFILFNYLFKQQWLLDTRGKDESFWIVAAITIHGVILGTLMFPLAKELYYEGIFLFTITDKQGYNGMWLIGARPRVYPSLSLVLDSKMSRYNVRAVLI